MEIYHLHSKDSLPGVRSVVKLLVSSELASAFKRGSLIFSGQLPAHKWKTQVTGQAISTQHGTPLMDSLNSRGTPCAGTRGVITIWQLHLPNPASFFHFCKYNPNSGSASAPQRSQPVTVTFPEFNHCSMITPFLMWYVMKYLRVKNHDLCNFLSKDSPK